MADKNSTLILKVDLDCHLCYKKIKKVLCKLQEKEDIKAIVYDEKTKQIMIAGPFDPDKVSNWLCCRACKIIKEIEVKDKPKDKSKDSKAVDAKPKTDKPKDEKPKDGKPKDGKSKDDKAKDGKSKDDKPKNDKQKDGKSKDDKSKGDKVKNGKPDAESPKENAPKSVKIDPKPILIPQRAQMDPTRNEFGMIGGYPQMPYQQGWPVGSMGPMGLMGQVAPAAPACCFRPLYEGFYGGYRCCTCGTVCGYGVAAPPVGFYGGPSVVDPYKGNQFFCEEESSCSIM